MLMSFSLLSHYDFCAMVFSIQMDVFNPNPMEFGSDGLRFNHIVPSPFSDLHSPNAIYKRYKLDGIKNLYWNDRWKLCILWNRYAFLLRLTVAKANHNRLTDQRITYVCSRFQPSILKQWITLILPGLYCCFIFNIVKSHTSKNAVMHATDL